MKIGILSDSHLKSGYTKDVDFLKDEGCEYLIHAGDLCIEKNLELLEKSGLKYIAVFGNNDKEIYLNYLQNIISNKNHIILKLKISNSNLCICLLI